MKKSSLFSISLLSLFFTISLTKSNGQITFSGVPVDITIECDDIPPNDTPTAESTCPGDVIITLEETIVEGDCIDQYTITREWTATDECDNSETVTQIITVEDTTPPILENTPEDIVLNCGASLPYHAYVTASDNCDTNVSKYYEQIENGVLCEGGNVTRIWTATDNCGNTTEYQQVITMVIDIDAPELFGIPADITLECGDNLPSPAYVTASDNCDSDVDVIFSEETGSNSCELIRSWTAIDDCGNQSIGNQVITFTEDNEPPVLQDVPTNLTISCGEDIPLPANVTATDNCDTDVEVSLTENIITDPCGTIERTWIAIDNCGNTSTATQIITLPEDNEPPTILEFPDDITLYCNDALPSPGIVVATDNCDTDVEIELAETGSMDACQDGVIYRTWTATDNCGNSSTYIQVITFINDHIAPLLFDLPVDITLECGEEIPFPAWVVATDNCDSDVDIEMVETSNVEACCGGIISRVWIATDNCGNVSRDTQNIFVEECPAKIYGSLIVDKNGNCEVDEEDIPFPNQIITADNLIDDSYFLYGNTNEEGNYIIECDTIDYFVFIDNSSNYYTVPACAEELYPAHLNSEILEDTVNFFVTPVLYCPYLEVDISTPRLRRCQSSNYYISYCNNGSEIAENAYIEVSFDEELEINSSTIPWTNVSGNTYTFDLGDIGVFECGSFYVNASVACDETTFIGQTLCAEAHIYPDIICLPDTTQWTGAKLKATAECLGSENVYFELTNIGSADMLEGVGIIIIEDIVLRVIDTVTLGAGESINWTLPVDGISQRIIAQQPNDYPFSNFTTDLAVLCNTDGIPSPGPINDITSLAFPNDEEEPFVAVDCQEIVGSYDPNDKSVFPRGVSLDNIILNDIDLEYKIRFQNTGNDTAFVVVVTDSISPYLDITSIKFGASSHPYQANIYGTGVIEFSFEDINLVDSFTNEPMSHGFVQYKIGQKEGNIDGDIISNNADIFFDYNPAIRTNTVINSVGNITFDTLLINAIKVPFANEISINIYPNPSKDIIIFDLGQTVNNSSLEIFSLDGKLQNKIIVKNTNQFKIKRDYLSSGTYLFVISNEKGRIASGKFSFQ